MYLLIATSAGSAAHSHAGGFYLRRYVNVEAYAIRQAFLKHIRGDTFTVLDEASYNPSPR